MASRIKRFMSGSRINGGNEDRSHLTPILTTKLYRPPVTPDLEQRTRLIERLESGSHHPLALISAPAGYGKTVLASQWLESSACPSAWVSLDEGDNDLHTFISYLLAAVHSGFPALELRTQSLLQAPNPPQLPILARYLLNDLNRIDVPFILALDDIHSIQEPAIYELLSEVLRSPPHSLHLLLIGRRTPNLPLASLRAHGLVTEIHDQDLRFSLQETAGLMRQMLQREIDEAVAAEWVEKTEGWVAALRLAILSLRHRGLADDLRVNIQGDSRYLRDYLLAEVLAHLPDAKQGWLTKTAILDRFCARLCEAVCRKDDDPADLTGEKFIDRLGRENLFLIPLDDQDEWFRFHHLFQKLLQDMLRAQLSALKIADLQSRASRWCAKQGLLDEALQYALAAGDVQAAVHLVQQHRYELMNYEQWHRLERWLKLLPGETVAQNPLLMTTKAYIAVFRGVDVEMVSFVQHVEQLLASHTPGAVEYECARGEIDTILALWKNIGGQPARSMELVQGSLERLPREAMHIRTIAIAGLAVGSQMLGNLRQGATVIRDALAEYDWPPGLQAKLMFYLCIAYLQEGDLANVYASARTGMWIMDKAPLPETLSCLRYCLSAVHYLRNDLAQAEPILQALVEDRAVSAPTYLAQGGFLLALIYQTQNHPAEAIQVIDLLEAHFQETKDLLAHAYTEAFRIELLLRQGKLAEARRLRNMVNFEVRQPIWYFYTPQLTPIKLLLAERTPESLGEARTRLDVLDESMGRIHRNNVRIDVLALQALVCAAQGDKPAALEKLGAAIELGSLGGNMHSFVDLGTSMASLLLHLKRQNIEKKYSEYVERILAAFPKRVMDEIATTLKIITAVTPVPIRPMNTSLTRQEIKILKLLATDLTLKEIALELQISYGTINSHTKNIYSKLEVHKRGEAVKRGVELALI